MPTVKRVTLRYKNSTNPNTWDQDFTEEAYANFVANQDELIVEVVSGPVDVEVTYPESPAETPSGGDGSGAGVTRVADQAERDSLDTDALENGHRVIYPNNDVEYWYDDAWSSDPGIGDLQIQ